MTIIDQIIESMCTEYTNESCLEICKKYNSFFVFNYKLVCDLCKNIFNAKKRTNEWDENSITTHIINSIMDNLESKFHIDVFKQKVPAETKYGDIAFVVTFYPEGDYQAFTGVAFIEAKKDYVNRNYHFHHFQKNQMNNFLEHTTSSYYLFYSHHKFLPIIDTRFLYQVVQAKQISDRQLTIDDINEFKLIAFPSQINRFLTGYDLDFSKAAISIAEGKKNIVPKFIVHAHVSNSGGGFEPTPDQTPPFNPNPDLYKKITKKDLENKINSTIKKENQKPGDNSPSQGGGFSPGP